MKLLLTEEFPAALASGLEQIASLSYPDYAIKHIDLIYPRPPHKGSSWYQPAYRDR